MKRLQMLGYKRKVLPRIDKEKKPKYLKGWAILWNLDKPMIGRSILGVYPKKGDVISLHKNEPVSSQENLFKVVEIEYKIII